MGGQRFVPAEDVSAPLMTLDVRVTRHRLSGVQLFFGDHGLGVTWFNAFATDKTPAQLRRIADLVETMLEKERVHDRPAGGQETGPDQSADA